MCLNAISHLNVTDRARSSAPFLGLRIELVTPLSHPFTYAIKALKIVNETAATCNQSSHLAA